MELFSIIDMNGLSLSNVSVAYVTTLASVIAGLGDIHPEVSHFPNFPFNLFYFIVMKLSLNGANLESKLIDDEQVGYNQHPIIFLCNLVNH